MLQMLGKVVQVLRFLQDFKLDPKLDLRNSGNMVYFTSMTHNYKPQYKMNVYIPETRSLQLSLVIGTCISIISDSDSPSALKAKNPEKTQIL